MTKPADLKYVWWFFTAATILVYFYGLGLPLVGPDEPRYAQVAREMYERSDWITPTLGGYEWFEKPALLYWLQIIGYKLFSVSEFGARFGPALFGLGTIAGMWVLGRFAGAKTEVLKAVDFANLLALLTATTLSLLVFARGASFDIIVTFPLTASLVGFFVADQARPDENRKQTVGLVAFYFFAGVAVLAKGLIGVVFPFAIVGLYFLFSKRLPPGQFLFSLTWGIPALVAVAAVWNLPMYLRHGWKFIDEFYIQHHFQRYTSNKYQHPQPFYFYFWVLPLMAFPWTPWVFAGIFRFIRSALNRSASLASVSGGALIIFATAWISVPLLFFSASGSKLPGYILPAVPAAAIFSVSYIGRSVEKQPARINVIFAIAFLMVAIIPAAIISVAPRYFERGSVKRLITVADNSGHRESTIIGFRTIDHGAEFYAPGRLVRDASGKQKWFNEPHELAAFLGEHERPVLVLVPLEHRGVLFECFEVVEITNNGDLAIAALKNNDSSACF